MKRLLIALSLVLIGVAAFAATPKNIILFIGDGMSLAQRMTADEFARKFDEHPDPVMNRLPYHSLTRTCSADSLITDSAAAATAIACGAKTKNHYLGVDPKGNRLTSCAEAAKAAGKKVGIVTTVTINHATPSGFYAHVKDRNAGYDIGLDLLASNFDYFAGGGLSKHNDTHNKHYKGDIYELAKKAGYMFIKKDKAAFCALKPGGEKVWYVATSDVMPFAIDKGDWENVASLADMTAKGIQLLDNKKGFFMMVEGGKIDYANHANDAATSLREVLAFDDAVRVAVEWQKSHPDTLVIVTGDHETGGMTMGVSGTGYNYYVEHLAKQKCSVEKVREHIREAQPQTLDDLMPFLRENFSFDPTKQEKDELDRAFAYDIELARKGQKDDERYDATKISHFPATVKRLYSQKCTVGWTSVSHTALPVVTTAKGPGAERFMGYMENSDIGKTLKGFYK